MWNDVFNDTMTHFDDLGDLSDPTNQVIKATKMTADITLKLFKKLISVSWLARRKSLYHL